MEETQEPEKQKKKPSVTHVLCQLWSVAEGSVLEDEQSCTGLSVGLSHSAFISRSLSLLLSSLTSAPQQAPSSALLHDPGNTHITQESGFL